MEWLGESGWDFWGGLGSLGYFPAMDMVRQALPMVMAFLKMAIVICMPLILIISAYQLKTAMTLTVVFFALIFVDFWFQLARWVDSTILNALYGSGSPHLSFDVVLGLNVATQDAILNFVMGTMFIILPMFWITALSWAAINAGSILGGLANGTGDVKNAGGSSASFTKDGISSTSQSLSAEKTDK